MPKNSHVCNTVFFHEIKPMQLIEVLETFWNQYTEMLEVALHDRTQHVKHVETQCGMQIGCFEV